MHRERLFAYVSCSAADVNDFALSLYRKLPLHNAIDYIRIQRSVTQVQKYTCKSVSKTIGEEYIPPPAP